jgi:hypothetical protein
MAGSGQSTSDDWLPTKDAMAYIGVKRSESLPLFVDMPLASARRWPDPQREYRRVRTEKRGRTKFYYRPDLDDYLAFRDDLARRYILLSIHKPNKICAECGEDWPCTQYRKAIRGDR